MITQQLQKLEPIWQKGVWFLWLCLVAALPITSFPLFAKVLQTTAVAPASGIFVILLALLWLPVYLLRNGRFPFQLKPALLFFMFAMFTIGLGFLRYVPDYKNASMVKAALEGVATLGLGVLFYTVTTAMPNSEVKIKQTLRIVNWGGLAIIIWSLVQAAVSFIYNDFTDGMRAFQHLFSTTVLFDGRATGFASEPSWLAHQLNLLYLMYWMAATKNKFSAHSFRIWKFTFENLLLAAGFVVLFVTLSRGGLVAFMLVLAFLFLLANIRFAKWMVKKWNARNTVLVGILTGLAMVILYLGILVGGLLVLSKLDPRMEKVFQFSSEVENPLLNYADNLQFGERVVYWQTGWNIFNDFPVSGVGVGFSGYYFPQYLPDYAWQLPEVNKLTGWSSGLLNVKNLWTRLMAETGIIGFSLFVIFLVVIAFTAKDLSNRKDQLSKTIGWMGIFMLITFILEEFSVDSFALPYYWFTLGLVVAASRWIRSTELDSHG
jgi:hypothetical protein